MGKRLSAARLESWFTEYLASRIGCCPNEIDLDVPLRDLGLASADVLAIPGDLAESFGHRVSDLAVWDNPSAADLIQSVVGGGAVDSGSGRYGEGMCIRGFGRRTDCSGRGGVQASWRGSRTRRTMEVPRREADEHNGLPRWTVADREGPWRLCKLHTGLR